MNGAKKACQFTSISVGRMPRALNEPPLVRKVQDAQRGILAGYGDVCQWRLSIFLAPLGSPLVMGGVIQQNVGSVNNKMLGIGTFLDRKVAQSKNALLTNGLTGPWLRAWPQLIPTWPQSPDH
jgi:hypothetical protein